METKSPQKSAQDQSPSIAASSRISNFHLNDGAKWGDYGARRHMAEVEGRITHAIPTYIGTWSPNYPTTGLFEMFVEKRVGVRISGTIKDVIGTASFDGIIRSNTVHDGIIGATTIHFSKQYDQDAILIGGEKNPIHYKGKQKDGRTIGTYTFESDKTDIRPFWMYEFEKVAGSVYQLLRADKTL